MRAEAANGNFMMSKLLSLRQLAWSWMVQA